MLHSLAETAPVYQNTERQYIQESCLQLNRTNERRHRRLGLRKLCIFLIIPGQFPWFHRKTLEIYGRRVNYNPFHSKRFLAPAQPNPSRIPPAHPSTYIVKRGTILDVLPRLSPLENVPFRGAANEPGALGNV